MLSTYIKTSYYIKLSHNTIFILGMKLQLYLECFVEKVICVFQQGFKDRECIDKLPFMSNRGRVKYWLFLSEIINLCSWQSYLNLYICGNCLQLLCFFKKQPYSVAFIIDCSQLISCFIKQELNPMNRLDLEETNCLNLLLTLRVPVPLSQTDHLCLKKLAFLCLKTY